MTDLFDSKRFLQTVTTQPGVYQMESAAGDVLYVGKASNLKNRLSSYFLKTNSLSRKTQRLVEQITNITVTLTPDEAQALLLENTLIKRFKPKYNILLRDDKSYPYIYVAWDQEFPRLEFCRRKKVKNKGLYFGPYADSGAARETLQILQKLFKVRTCKPAFFNNRSRPCLQYQIKRCTAPCVGLISAEDYRASVSHALQFLKGKNKTLIQDLTQKMQEASINLAFEKAAHIRDQLQALQTVHAQGKVSSETRDLDILGITLAQGFACVYQLQVRSGEVQRGLTFFPQLPEEEADSSTVLEAFITQYYLALEHQDEVPGTLVLPVILPNSKILTSVLSQVSGRSCKIIDRELERHRGIFKIWVRQASENSAVSLRARITRESTIRQRFINLKDALQLSALPKRMECFDISHTFGELPVASCVVFDEKGPNTSQYRQFNLHDITPGDDYAAMQQALERRFANTEVPLPDVLFIDGGQGQLSRALEVLEKLQITTVFCVGIAKGAERKAGHEDIILPTRDIIPIDPTSPAFHLIAHIRDEAHRFAVASHTHKRDKKRVTSPLEGLEGVGPAKRRALYKKFGGLSGLKHASLEAISQVPGITAKLAERIFNFLHE